MNKKEEILESILKLAANRAGSGDRKRLACAEAFALAEKFDTKIIEIGRICNEHDIRICKCQLGCFE
jgi:hypothetical protein